MCVSRRQQLLRPEALDTPSKAAKKTSQDNSIEPAGRTGRFITPLLPFLLVGAGVVHGGLQEELMSSLGGQTPLIITSFEFACCATLSVCWLLVNKLSFDVPRRQLFEISVLVLASLVAGNTALRWVSYPVKVVLKSTKLIPTMAIGAVLLRKRYTAADWCAPRSTRRHASSPRTSSAHLLVHTRAAVVRRSCCASGSSGSR